MRARDYSALGVAWLQSAKRFPDTYVALAYATLVVACKLVAPDEGWAANDSRNFYAKFIRYFLDHGFTLHYPTGLGMFAGMPMLYALIFKVLGIHSFAYNGWTIFCVQSISGAAFLVGLMKVVRDTGILWPNRLTCYLVCLSSSYLLYSWMWPVTDMIPMACMIWTIVCVQSGRAWQWKMSVSVSALTLLASLCRQNYVVLAAAPMATIFVRTPLRDWASIIPRAWHTVLPLVVGGGCVGFLYSVWGGLVPPDCGFDHLNHTGLAWPSIAHVFALTGLIAWPFALVASRGEPRIDRYIAGGAIVVAGLMSLFVPLNYDYAQGRWGSMVWAIEAKMQWAGLRNLFVSAAMAVGLYIGGQTAFRVCRGQGDTSTVLVCGLFLATNAIIAQAWQRYVEVPLLLALGIFWLGAADIKGNKRLLLILWFAFYLGLTIAKVVIGAKQIT